MWVSPSMTSTKKHQGPSYSTAPLRGTMIRLSSQSTSFTLLCHIPLHSMLSLFYFLARKTDLSHLKVLTAKETPCLNSSTTNSSFPIIPCNFPSPFYAWLLSSIQFGCLPASSLLSLSVVKTWNTLLDSSSRPFSYLVGQYLSLCAASSKACSRQRLHSPNWVFQQGYLFIRWKEGMNGRKGGYLQI